MLNDKRLLIQRRRDKNYFGDLRVTKSLVTKSDLRAAKSDQYETSLGDQNVSKK